jgi:hypothetical protein
MGSETPSRLLTRLRAGNGRFLTIRRDVVGLAPRDREPEEVERVALLVQAARCLLEQADGGDGAAVLTLCLVKQRAGALDERADVADDRILFLEAEAEFELARGRERDRGQHGLGGLQGARGSIGRRTGGTEGGYAAALRAVAVAYSFPAPALQKCPGRSAFICLPPELAMAARLRPNQRATDFVGDGRGNVTVNTVPEPSSDLTEIVARCARAMVLAI